MVSSHAVAILGAALVIACASDDGGAAGTGEGSSDGSSGAPPATTSTGLGEGTSTGVDEGTSTSADEGTSTGAAIECGADALAAGQYDDLEIEHDSVMRSYNLYIPAGVDGTQPIPLVLNFHGFTSDPGQQQFFSQMDPVADAHGFAVAYPAGLNNSWNAGYCCGQSATDGVDDVGFALAVIEDVKSRACIDDKRVYSTGMSNGGFLSHRLACEQADSFAAIAPVAGVLGIPEAECTPSRHVPVMHFHGTLDPLVPYDGAPEAIAVWADRDGCPGEAVEVFAEADVHCEAHEDCEDGTRVELCTVEGGGHCWPGQEFCPYGASTTTIDASERMAEFFAGYALP